MLAAVAEHERQVSPFATTHIHSVFKGIHELTEQANLRLEATACLIQLMDLSLGLVSAVFQHLGGAALENILVREFFVGFANHGQHASAQVQFFAQAVIGLDTVTTILKQVACRKLCQMSAGIALVNIKNVLDFVDRKFSLVQKQQYLEAHFVRNGSKKVHAGDNRFTTQITQIGRISHKISVRFLKSNIIFLA